MKSLACVFLLASTAAAVAQSPLTTFYGGTNQANPGAQFFFDLSVSTTLTIQALEVNLSSAPGVEGTIEVYTTLPGVGTYLGNTGNAAQWSALPVATGTIVAAGADLPSYCCLSPGLTLTSGTIGIALRHIGVQPYNTLGNGTPVPGGGGPGTNQTYSTTELTVLSGHVQNVPWVRGAAPRAWNGSIYYALGSGAHVCAKNSEHGRGCYQQQASFYQFFSHAPAASAALTGRTISLFNANPGYVVLPNQPGIVFVQPTGAATVLPAIDDGENPWTWPSGIPFGAGGPTTLYVHSNGIVGDASVTGLLPNAYRANVTSMLDVPFRGWFSWHDYNPAASGSGQIKCEEAGGMLYITWEGVESYPTATINPSTFQFQFELASGNVHYVWQSITALGDAAFGDSHVIGFSQAGPSLDPGPTDLTTFTAQVVSGADQAPLTLSLAARPAIGANVLYVVSNYTPSSFPVGIIFIAVADLPPFSPPGVDLAIIGAPNCFLNVDITAAPIQALVIAPSSLSFILSIPFDLTFLGNLWYSQAVWFDSTVNPFGALTSNAWKHTVGTF